MILKEMKIKTFSLIEEYYPTLKGLAEDDDVLNKINSVVNQVQMDLMKYRKINSKKVIEILKSDDREIDLSKEINDLYQIKKIELSDSDYNYEIITDYIIRLDEDFEGNIAVFYYKYPKSVKIEFTSEEEQEKEDNEFIFELEPVVLEIMPYGIAADLLKMDMISSYGRYFQEEYLRRLGNLDPRKSSGMIKIVGGIDV